MSLHEHEHDGRRDVSTSRALLTLVVLCIIATLVQLTRGESQTALVWCILALVIVQLGRD